jgi:tetratricopeptide (TPR) repeat protein
MHTIKHRPLALLCALTLTGAVCADTIIYRPETGKQVKRGVTMRSEGAKVISWYPAGSTKAREESAFEVALIEYDDAPDEYRRGLGYYTKGSWYDAIRNFEKALTIANRPVAEDEIPPVRAWWVNQYANYYLGECYRERAHRHPDEFPKAEAHYRKVTELDPRPRLWGDAMIGLGRTLAAQSKYREALDAFQEVADLASRREIAPYLAMAARVAKAETHELAGDHSSAASDYERLARDVAEEQPELALSYSLKSAFALLSAGSTSRARRAFEDLQSQYPDSSIAQAGAWNGLGEIALERGEARQAREAYGHTIALYGAASEEYERALAGMVRALRAIGSREEGSQELAASYLEELRHRDQRSPFLEGL